MNRNVRQYQNEYSHSKKKFDILKNGLIVTQLNQKLNLEDFDRLAPKDYTEQEWGFPKDRRNLKENDLQAAIRECNEETGLSEGDYKIPKLRLNLKKYWAPITFVISTFIS